MSPVCENRPHMVYARVCRGMQGHVQNDRDIFVRDLCQRRHSISSMKMRASDCRKMRRGLTVEKEAQAQ
jgi:hypothetical protein